jgi:dihydroorotate dehydrogenase
MSWLYRTLVRPALFAQDSESIHNFTLANLGKISRSQILCDALESFFGAQELPVDAFGLQFPNPIGLAAGMDKDAEALPAWAALGFGFTELGAVTWHPQPGNPRPRVFRAIPDEALVNRMGFNNCGAEAMASRLREWKQSDRWPRHPVGVNLGKSKITPLEGAAEDYARSLEVLWEHLDFFVVNVSSPNTPNLRQLQDKAALDTILCRLQQVNVQLASQFNRASKPILVKIAPDLSFTAIDEILELMGPRNVAGLVATNTTLARPTDCAPELKGIYSEAGGLSGKPLRSRSTEVIRHVFQRTHGQLPIIGVGGIFSARDAWEKIQAGATLLQVYTGLVYEGPSVVKLIVGGLRKSLAHLALERIQEAVGTELLHS